MIIGKYNISKGSGSNASTGSTAVAGGGGAGANIDLTPITDKVAALETRVSQLETQLIKVNAVLSGLDSRFLSKFGDRSEYAYYLGALYTDFIQSEMYNNGVGFRLSGNATAAVDEKYKFIIKDVGWASVPFSTIQQSEITIVDTDTDEETAQMNANGISIGATAAAGYILLDFGADLTHERCFTEISKRVEYSVEHTVGDRINVTGFTDAEADSNGHYILHFQKADAVRITIRFRYTYAFRKYGDVTSGTYRLYIRGTDPSHNLTDCFAAASKSATLSAGGLTVLEGTNGARITSAGVQMTTDGGTTWHS